MKKWISSRRTFKDSLNLSVQWIEAIGAIVLIQLLFLYAGYLVFLLLERLFVSDSSLLLFFQLLVIFVLFLWQVLWNVSLVRMLKNGKQADLFSEMRGAGLKKLPEAVALSIILFLLMVAGGVLLLIPAIIVAVYLLFSFYILVLEDVKIIESLKRSYYLVKGWWWRIFLRYIFMFFLVTIVSVIGMVPQTGFATSVLLSLILSPIFVIYVGKTYLQLTEIKKEQPRSNIGVFKIIMIIICSILVFGSFVITRTFSSTVGEIYTENFSVEQRL